MIHKLAGFFFLGGVASLALDGPSVLEARCVSCHNTKFKQSGLDVSSRTSLLLGGSRGPALAQSGVPPTPQGHPSSGY